jgi:hypothetical protein
MTIFHEKNGWRDKSDEGPGCAVNKSKEEWSLLRYYSEGEKAMIHVKRDGKVVAQFFRLEDATDYVDAMCLKATDETDAIEFLLGQMQRKESYQDHDRIRELGEKYGVEL